MIILPDAVSSTSFFPCATRISTLFIPMDAVIGVAGDIVGEAGWRVAVDAAVGTDVLVMVGTRDAVAVGVGGNLVAVGVAVGADVLVAVGTRDTVAVGVGGSWVEVGVAVGVDALVAVAIGVDVGITVDTAFPQGNAPVPHAGEFVCK